MPAILALRVMLGLIHLFQLYVSQIYKTILANGIVWVTKIALRCFPCVTLLRVSREIAGIPSRYKRKVLNDLFSVCNRGLRLLKKARFLRQELSNFHHSRCRVLLRSYSFDLPLQNGEISVWKLHNWVQNMLTIWRHMFNPVLIKWCFDVTQVGVSGSPPSQYERQEWILIGLLLLKTIRTIHPE